MTAETRSPADAAAAFSAWEHALGAAHVDASPPTRDRYGCSTTPWSERPLGVIRPGDTAEVQTAVRIAQRHRTPVYPISGGKNWGLGDACPTGPGQVVMDLRRLNRIREVDERLGYAVIEAGVTQGQLYEHLSEHAPSLMYDATGAGPDATIVGNIMERGYGHSPYGDRFQNSCNYEVVLPTGELLRTGFGAIEGCSTAHLLKPGLGPSLDGLFTQSNRGVVTAMTVWLLPRPERIEAFAFKLDDESLLGPVIDALRPLRMSGVLTSLVHVANDLRVVSSKTNFAQVAGRSTGALWNSERVRLRKAYGVGAWNGLGGLYGDRDTVLAARRAVRRALRGLATPRFINDGRLRLGRRVIGAAGRLGLAGGLTAQLKAIESVFELLKGKPVAEHLRGAAWRRRKPLTGQEPNDPLGRGDGLIWLSPTLPMLGRDAERLHQISADLLQEHGFDPLMTLVSLSGRAMCSPTTICFDRDDPDEFQHARACYESLLDATWTAGYPPYRLGVQSMPKLRDSTPSNVLAASAEGVLSPGRYAAQ